jgi:vacuolar-type H+-ATPase subunit I/STV1
MKQILPQFTVRTFLWLTAALGVVSLVIGRAVRGDLWAQSFSMAVLFIVVAFILFCMAFSVAFVVASIFHKPNQASSPFAGEDPPDQVMVPIEIFPKT